MAKGIFSDKAMEHISSPEKLDQNARITKPGIWVVMVAVLAAFIGVGYWAFTGNMSDGINIPGIIFPSTGVTVSYAAENGTVTDVLVNEGDRVEKGDVLAIVPDTKILSQLSALNAQLAAATNAETQKTISDQIEVLKYQYIKNSLVRADSDGVIQSVVSSNSGVAQGDAIATNISQSSTVNTKEVLAYVPYSQSEILKAGMEAQVSPTAFPRESYGYINGVITQVGTTPVTADSIKKTMGTTDYVSAMNLESSSFVEIRIRLNIDSATKSGFSWSSDKGRDLAVEVGSICQVKVVTQNKKPISLIFNLA